MQERYMRQYGYYRFSHFALLLNQFSQLLMYDDCCYIAGILEIICRPVSSTFKKIL